MMEKGFSVDIIVLVGLEDCAVDLEVWMPVVEGVN